VGVQGGIAVEVVVPVVGHLHRTQQHREVTLEQLTFHWKWQRRASLFLGSVFLGSTRLLK
jgi:hypothetical protein